MAREIKLQAILNFSIASHAQFTAMRTTAKNFAATHSGDCDIISSEDDDAAIPYYARLTLLLPVASRAQANTRMTDIDDALPSLPDLIANNGPKLRYEVIEEEV